MNGPGEEPTVEIDVRAMSVPERREAITQALDLLRSGQTVVLVTDRDPKPILGSFEERHGGELRCVVTATSPGCFRSQMRLGHTPPPINTVAESLAADHARLDGLLDAARPPAGAPSFDEAAATCARYAEALNRHMGAEEDILFPAMRHMTDAAAQPVDRMLADHGRLRKLAHAMAAAIEARDLAAWGTAWQEARRLLGQHQHGEQEVIYPITDWALGPDEQSALVRRLRAE